MSIGYSIIEDQFIKSLDRRPQTAFRAIGVCLLELFIKMSSGILLLQFTRNLESLLHSTQEGTCRIHITSSIQLKNFGTLPHKSRRRKNFKICYPNAIFPRTKIKGLYQKVCQNGNEYNIQGPDPPFFLFLPLLNPFSVVNIEQARP